MMSGSLLFLLIIILMIGGVLAWITGFINTVWPRVISLIAVSINLLLILPVLFHSKLIGNGNWILEYHTSWIPALGVSFHLALDGLSILMLILSFFVGIISVLISWKEINYKVGFFHFNTPFPSASEIAF